jgi:hypothetical protein
MVQMNVLDSTFDLLLRSLKVRHKALSREKALQAAGEFSHWFAVELIYKNQPVRLILATSQALDELNQAKPAAALPGRPDQAATAP